MTDEVEAVVDINPHKHGKFLAGTGHEIVAPEALRRLRPDCVVIMNGIYTDEIRADLGASRPAAGDQRAGMTVLAPGRRFSATPCT